MYIDDELIKESTTKNFFNHHVKNLELYNLDIFIAVVYRGYSKKATLILKDYMIINGFNNNK